MTDKLSKGLITATGTTTPRSLANRFGDVVDVKDFSKLVVGNDWTAAIQAAIDASKKIGKLVCNVGSIEISSDIRIVEKGRPDNGVYEVDFTGTIFSGTGSIIFDSCKNLQIKGLQAPTLDMKVRGVWYSDFSLCKASRLIFCDVAGTTYSSTYWLDFRTCVFQTIIRGADTGVVNSIHYYGVSLRGNTGQGFTSTADYNIEFQGNSNAQSWVFYGGDISYAQVALYNIAPSNTTGDIELTFNGVYFDSVLPEPSTRNNFKMSVIDGHTANVTGFNAEMAAASKGVYDIFRSDRIVKLSTENDHNLVPLGDFNVVVDNPVDYFISNTGGNTLTTSAGGPYNQLLTIAGSASATTFVRSKPLPFAGPATVTLMLRSSAGFGTQSVKVGFGAAQSKRYRTFDVTEEFQLYTLTDPKLAAAGVVPSLSISGNAGSFSYDVGMLSVTAGIGGGTRGALNATIGAQHTHTVNLGNLTALTSTNFDVSVKGAVVGQAVSVAASDLASLIVTGQVVSDGVVKVVVFNPTQVAIDPPSTDIVIRTQG